MSDAMKAIEQMRNYPDGSYMRCPFCGCKSATHEPSCAIEVVASALSTRSAGALPAGVKAMPRFVTGAMLEAGASAVDDMDRARSNMTYGSRAQAIYHRMFDAAPEYAQSATERITGMPMIKALKDQRDECAEVLREIMAKLREQFGERMDQSIDPHAWTLGWQTLTARADAILTKCPSYTQQLRNLAEGLGMTYEELCAAADRLKDKATNSVPDRNATP